MDGILNSSFKFIIFWGLQILSILHISFNRSDIFCISGTSKWSPVFSEKLDMSQSYHLNNTEQSIQSGTQPKCSIKKAEKQVKRNQQHCKQLVYIYWDLAKALSLSAFIRLFTLPYKRQDRAGNSNSEKVQSAFSHGVNYFLYLALNTHH